MDLLIVAGLILTGGLLLGSVEVVGRLKQRKARKAFFAARQSAVARVEEDVTRLVGTVIAKSVIAKSVIAKRTMRSPLSEREVIGFRLELKTAPAGTDRRGLSRTVTVVEDFYLLDESGRALIKAGGHCELRLPPFGRAVEMQRPSEELARQMDLSGGDANEVFRQSRVFAREFLLCAGDRVMVRGLASRPIDAAGIDAAGIDAAGIDTAGLSVNGFRQPPRAVVVEAPQDEPLVITRHWF